MASSHIFTIPSFLSEDMMLLHSSWLRTGSIPRAAVQDLIESWTCTKSGKTLAALLDGRQRWFIRLDQMSPKDSPLGGHLPSSSLSEVITKICSSMRAYGEYMDGHGRDSGPKTQLILNPWNDKMDAATEFRVFIPPPAARGVSNPNTTDFRVSGISQYKWHSPLKLPFDAPVIWVTDRVWKGARDMLASIADYMCTALEADIEDLLLRHGFSFDIAL